MSAFRKKIVFLFLVAVMALSFGMVGYSVKADNETTPTLSMEKFAYARTEDFSGLRFLTYIDGYSADYTYGMLVVRQRILTENGVSSLDLTNYATAKAQNIIATSFADKTIDGKAYKTYCGVLAGAKDSDGNYTDFPEDYLTDDIYAISYSYKTADGESTATYTDACCMSLGYVACAAVANETVTEEEAPKIFEISNKVTQGKTISFAKNDITLGVNSADFSQILNNDTGIKPIYTQTNAELLNMDGNGAVTVNAGKSGTSTITAKVGNLSASVNVTVNAADANQVPVNFGCDASGLYGVGAYNGQPVMKYNKTSSGNTDGARLKYTLPDLTTYKALTFDFVYVSNSVLSANNVAFLSARYSSNPGSTAITYVDEDGNLVAESSLELGKWYTAYIVFSNIPDAGEMYLYPTHGMDGTVEMYIQNVYFVKSVEGDIVFNMERASDANVVFGMVGFDSETGKTIYQYSVKVDTFAPDSYKIGYPTLKPNNKYLAFEYRVTSSKDGKVNPIGTYGSGTIYYFDSNNVGIAASDLTLNTWYTVYYEEVSATWLYIAGITGSGSTVEIKNARYVKGTTYGEGQLGVTFISEGKVSGKFVGKLNDGKIIQSYVSDGSSAWDGRIWFNYSSTDYKKLVVKFKAEGTITSSSGASDMAWQFTGLGSNGLGTSEIKYYNEANEEVGMGALTAGTVYTAVIDISSLTDTGNKTIYPTYGRGVAVTIDIYEAYLDTTPVA